MYLFVPFIPGHSFGQNQYWQNECHCDEGRGITGLTDK